MFRWVVLSSLLVFVQSAAVLPKATLDDRIVGGNEVDISEIPYQVSLQSKRNGHFCGGTLVSPIFVITAAHCTVKQSASNIKVRIGSNRHYSGGVVISVSGIINHPYYDPESQDFDISIVILSSPQTWTTKFAKLPIANSMPQEGDWATVSGWGDTLDSEQSTDLLRAVQVPIVNQDECNDLYNGDISDRMVCAGDVEEGGIDSCQGDSGGPLTLNDNLIGIVSWGNGCADIGYPGVYTLVSSVRQWIQDSINM